MKEYGIFKALNVFTEPDGLTDVLVLPALLRMEGEKQEFAGSLNEYATKMSLKHTI